jgi:Uncharacterized conserved protein
MNGPALVLERAEADDRAEFRQAVLDGLARTPRAIPAKFLYDARGSALFDQICELPNITSRAPRRGFCANASPSLPYWPAPAARWSSSAAARA